MTKDKRFKESNSLVPLETFEASANHLAPINAT
ncbi:hypothetical protein HDF17_002926 [Granulicella arctica]|uniref:Uncharacterized protein n=1 Tax=Granulicella arctica TaxID=940613 RepID=A0A7Y9TH31_9BACT|nr:hypothetical protein [Granulicella arctica]